MADENTDYLPLKIDILIGSSYHWKFVANEIRRGEIGPVVLASKLGYILSGSVHDHRNTQTMSTYFQTTVVSHVFNVVAERLDEDEMKGKDLLKIYGNEELSNNPDEDIEVLKRFEENTVFVDGRYEVKLPFKLKCSIFGDNYRNSVTRLGSLLKQFEKNERLLLQYDAILKEKLSRKVVEIVPSEENTCENQLY